jgi:hypothetical protein
VPELFRRAGPFTSFEKEKKSTHLFLTQYVASQFIAAIMDVMPDEELKGEDVEQAAGNVAHHARRLHHAPRTTHKHACLCTRIQAS